MSTTFYYEDKLYPPNDDGVADEEKQETDLAIFVSNFHGKHQVYLRVNDEDGVEKTLCLNKEQVQNLHHGIDYAGSYLGYFDK